MRPAQGRTVARVDVLSQAGSLVRTLRVRTNPSGYFTDPVPSPRMRHGCATRRSGSAPDGKELRSRVARAGPPIRYLDAGEPPPPRNSGR